MEDVKTIHVLNLGAGVQSTRLYLEAVEGIEHFDYAVMADTGEEPQAVYAHLRWLQSLDGPPILLGNRGVRLGDQLISGLDGNFGRFVSIPAFTQKKDGTSKAITKRICTREFKIEVVEQVIRRQILGLAKYKKVPKSVRVVQTYGITVDEAVRAQKIKNKWNLKWSSPRFPFLERFVGRTDCIKWLKEYGMPHECPRSACVFCPFKSNYEWRWLRDKDPEGWQRALAIDEALRNPASRCTHGLRDLLYLHKSCVPLKDAIIDENPHEVGFAIECTGGCGL